MNTALKTTKTTPTANTDGWVPATGYDVAASKGALAIIPNSEANENIPTANVGQHYLAKAKNGIEEWATEYANVAEGKSEKGITALMWVVYFSCWCLETGNNPETDLPDWGDTELTYRKAIDYAFDHAGVADASPIKSETSKRSQWAKCAEYIHKDGEYRVKEEAFVNFMGKFKGGIRGLYDHAVKELGKKSPGRNGKKGKPKSGSISSVSADAKIKADLDNLYKNPNYVLILLDANQGKRGKRKKNPKSPQAIANHIGNMDEFVTAWNASNDDINGDGGIMAMFREDETLDVIDAESDVETTMVSGGDDE